MHLQTHHNYSLVSIDLNSSLHAQIITIIIIVLFYLYKKYKVCTVKKKKDPSGEDMMALYI